MTKSSQVLTSISEGFSGPDAFGLEPGMSVFLIVASTIAMFAYGALSYIFEKEEASRDH